MEFPRINLSKIFCDTYAGYLWFDVLLPYFLNLHKDIYKDLVLISRFSGTHQTLCVRKRKQSSFTVLFPCITCCCFFSILLNISHVCTLLYFYFARLFETCFKQEGQSVITANRILLREGTIQVKR